MSNEFLVSIVAALVVVLAFIRIAGWMEQTADLRLSLFRPYRGETWPQGVQEEDGVTWRWARTDAQAADGQAGDDGDGPTAVDAGPTRADRVGGIRIGRARRR
jgi:hypothetical protein